MCGIIISVSSTFFVDVTIPVITLRIPCYLHVIISREHPAKQGVVKAAVQNPLPNFVPNLWLPQRGRDRAYAHPLLFCFSKNYYCKFILLQYSKNILQLLVSDNLPVARVENAR
jgi:hypothetical protein